MASTADFFAQGAPSPSADPQAVDPIVAALLARRQLAAPPAAPAPAPAPENDVLTDIGHGFAAGAMVGLPKMAGQALQAFTPTGSDLHAAGKNWAAVAEAHANDSDYRTTGTWGKAAESVAPSLATIAASGLAVAGAAAAGLAAPAVATIGAVAGAVAAGGLFGGSTFQDVLEKHQAAGDPNAQRAALIDGTIMGAGQTAAALVGGRIISGIGGAVLAKGAAQNVLDSFANPAIFKSLAFAKPGNYKGFGKDMLALYGVQVPVQAGTAAAMNAVENTSGIPSLDTGVTSWQAAKESVPQTLAMTTLLGPVSLFGAFRTNQARAKMYKSVEGKEWSPENPPSEAQTNQRLRALAEIQKQMGKVTDPQTVTSWSAEAAAAINRGEPVSMVMPEQKTPAPGMEESAQHVTTPTTPSDAERATEEMVRQQERPEPTPEMTPPAEGMGESGQHVGTEFPVSDAERSTGAVIGEQRVNVVAKAMLPAPKDVAIRMGEGGAQFVHEEPAPVDTRVPEPAYPPTKEGETKYIRAVHDLPANTPGSVIDRLRGLDRDQQLDELEKVWVEKKGATTDAPKYVEAIGETLKKAGRLNDEGKPSENARSVEPYQAPAEVVARAEPERPAVAPAAEVAARPVEVAQAERNAGPAPSAEGSAAGRVTLFSERGQADEMLRRENEAMLPQTPHEGSAKVAEGLDKIRKGMEREATGQGVLDHMQENNESPAAVADHFWKETFPNLPADQQAKFKAMLKEHSGGTGKVEDLDLPHAVEHLEGTERGFVALMRIANEKVKPTTQEQANKFAAPELPAVFPTGDTNALANAKKNSTFVPPEARRTEASFKAGRKLREQNAAQQDAVEQGQNGEGQVGTKQAFDLATAEGRARAAKANVADAAARRIKQEAAFAKLEEAYKNKHVWNAKTAELTAETNALRDEQKVKSTPEGAAKLLKNEAEIAQRNAQMRELENIVSSRMRTDEDLQPGQHEPAWSAGNALYTRPGALRENSHADTLSYLAAKIQLGHSPTEIEKELLAGRGAELRGAKSQTEMKLAMQELAKTPGTIERWDARVKALGDAVVFAKPILAKARAIEKAVARSVAEEAFDQQTSLLRIAQEQEQDRWIDDAITQIEAKNAQRVDAAADRMMDILTKKVAAAKETQREGLTTAMAAAIERAGVKNRGLAALSDDALGAKVAANPNARDVMEHLAQNHPHPLVRTIAKLLADWHPTALVVEIEDANFNGGRYNPQAHTIEIGRGGMNPITLMHETVHSLSHAALYRVLENVHRPVESLSKQERAEIEANKTLNTLRDAFAKVADLENPEHRLALENNHEFLSEALNNPDIAQLMGGANKLRQFYNAVRMFIGLDAKHQTDFEKLMQVAPTLFGSPNRRVTEIFNSAVTGTYNRPDGAIDVTSPGGAMEMAKVAGNKLAARASDWRQDYRGARLGWLRMTTYNNGAQWLARRIGMALKVEYPQHAAVFDAVYKAFVDPKSVIERRGAGNQKLLNSATGSNPLVRELGVLQKKYPKQVDAMGEVGRRAVMNGFDPRDSTFAEAKQRNPNVTKEMWDNPEVAENRAKWKQLTPEAAAMYEKLRLHNELGFARRYADTLNTINKVHGGDHDPSLDWWTHTTGADGRSEPSREVQLGKLNQAIIESKRDLDSKLSAAGFDPESKDGKNTTSHSEAVNDLLDRYNQQRGTPYIHLGRSGDGMLHFEVGGGEAGWERVRAIVTGKLGQGGLDRDMGKYNPKNLVVDMRFDNVRQHGYAEGLFKQMKDEGLFKNAEGESTWASGPINERYKSVDGATPTFIRKLNAAIDDKYSAATAADMKQQINDMYLQQLPESSPMKSSMFRDSTAGSSKNILKTFSDRETMNNRALVGAQSATRMGEMMSQLDEAMKGLKESGLPAKVTMELGQYASEVRQRVNESAEPTNTPTFDFWRSVAAPFRLALSPAYMLMTAYQPIQMTLPWLGKDHGFVASAQSMARNYGKSYGALNKLFAAEWKAGKGESFFDRAARAASPHVDFSQVKNADGTYMFHGAELELLQHLEDSGLVNFGQMQQIWRPPEDEKVAFGDFGRGTAKVNRIASAMPHYIEMSNRLVSALSAHELALTRGAKNEAERQKMMNDATPAQRQRAREDAMSVIRNTDGDHSQGNIARGLGRRGLLKGATPLLVGFNQYDFQMTESLVRLLVAAAGKKGDRHSEEAWAARRGIAGVLATTSAMAGTLGMPFMGMIAGVYNQVMSWGQDNSETPPDMEKSWRDHMNGIFGEKGGEIVSRGLPRLLDIDMSTRSGYQDLAPFTEFMTDRQKLGDRIKDQALNFLGPAVGVGVGMATGAQAMYEGNYPKAINDALPAFARNIGKAYRLSQYGYERQTGGNENIPIPVSTWNVAAQGMGFGSGRKAEQGEQQFQWDTDQKIMQYRNQIAHDKWLRAMAHDDPRGVSDAMESIVKTAVTQPQYRAAPAALGEAYKQRMQNEAIAGMYGGVHLARGAIPFHDQFARGMPAPQ